MESHAIGAEPGRNQRLLLYGVAAAVLVLAPHLMPAGYWLRIYTMTGLYVMLALGLNVVAGFAGLMDLGYAAFFGIGGYLFAILSSAQFDIHLPFPFALPLAAFATMAVGFALGSTSVRLKSDHLAIVTLAFAQVFRLLLVNLDRPINITGGVDGIYNLDPIRLLGFKLVSPVSYAYLIWICAALVIVGCFRLKRSRYGRGWEAIREDELAAEVVGVNTAVMKLKAFSAGAFIAGATGALFASFQGSVSPNNFDFPQLVTVYCMVILGGLGNVAGVVAGAILLSILPEFLREYGAFRMMSYGLILVVLMALRPQGIMGSLGFLFRAEKRPDNDEAGPLRTSTELCYRKKESGSGKRGETRGPGNQVVLEVNEVTQNFGGIVAVDHLSFHVREREILSIIGPNGAGKTTLFNLIAGIYPPPFGTIFYDGKRISGLKPHRIVRAGIARTFQSLKLFNAMTVLDNIKVALFCRTKADPLSIMLHLPLFKREENETQQKAEEALTLIGTGLTGCRFALEAASLAHADRRRIEIARALATGARLLLLDEPSAGMNPQEAEEITQFIRQLRDAYGYTIVVIEHKLDVVKSISDRVIVLDCGRKIAEGSYDEVAEDPRVVEVYLGRKRH